MPTYKPTLTELMARYHTSEFMPKTLPVLDGTVALDSLVWKQTTKGLVQVIAASEWHAIEFYPQHFQLENPAC